MILVIMGIACKATQNSHNKWFPTIHYLTDNFIYFWAIVVRVYFNNELD